MSDAETVLWEQTIKQLRAIAKGISGLQNEIYGLSKELDFLNRYQENAADQMESIRKEIGDREGRL